MAISKDNPYAQYANEGAQAPKAKPAVSPDNPYAQYAGSSEPAPAPQAPNDNTPAQATKQPETYGNGTGWIAGATGALKGAVEGASNIYHAVTEAPSKAANVYHEIKQQYDTGTLFTPEFQQASPLQKAESLLGGFTTGAAETGRAIAQIPNEVINTAGAVSQSLTGTGRTDVDIYSGLPASVDNALKPQTEQGKTIANIAPYTMQAAAAPLEIYAMSVKSLQDRGIPLTSENIAQETTKNLIMMGTGIGTGKALKAGAEFGAEIPGAIRGKASLGTTAEALGETGTERLYQGGDVGSQNAYRGVISDAEGNVVAPSSGLYTGESAQGLKAAEQRAGAPEINTQANVDRTVSGIAGEQGTTAQQAVGEATDQFIAVKNQQYNDALHGAQDILDNNNVSALKMGKTKEFVKQHLAEDADLDSLPPSAKKLLTKMGDADFKDLHTIDFYKRKLSNEASKAFRAGDTDTMSTMNSIKTRMKGELDATLNHLSPDAAKVYQEADQLFADYVDPLGRKSKASKIAGKENAELAANQLVGGSATARGNAADISAVMRQMKEDQRFASGAETATGFAEGMGNTARQRAQEAAERAYNDAEAVNPGSGAKAYANTFNRTLSQSQPAVGEVAGLGSRNESQINSALIDAVNTTKAQVVKPSTIPGNIAHIVGHSIPGLNYFTKPIANAIGSGADVVSLRAMRDQAIRNRIAQASPEEIETMYRMNQNTPTGAAMPYSAGIAGTQEQPQQAPTPFQADSNGMVTITLPGEPVASPEPVQHAQSYHAPRETTGGNAKLDHEGLKMYRALGHAETGHLKNRFIRTQAEESGVSTAYGPAQVTGSLAKDVRQRYNHIFTKDELNYLDRFIDQSEKMKHAAKDDPVYGYGKAGTLGNSAEDRRMYAQVWQKVLKQMYHEKGSWSKVAHAWRGNDKDTAYFAKVANHLRQQSKTA